MEYGESFYSDSCNKYYVMYQVQNSRANEVSAVILMIIMDIMI